VIKRCLQIVVLALLSLLTVAVPAAATPPPATGLLSVDTERALSKCRICHGDALQGQRSVPGLAGLRRRQILRRLTTAVPRPMQPIVRGLSTEEKETIASMIVDLLKEPVPAAPTEAP